MKSIIDTVFSLSFLIGSIIAARHRRMLGGNNAAIEDFPYVASLRYMGNFFCAGSIISERHILTSAHCIPPAVEGWQDYFKDFVTVHTGTSSSEEPGTSHKVQSFHVHPNWKVDKDGYSNDIAIITLKDPIVFDKNQQKVSLPSRNIQNDQTANLTGWGATSNLSWEKTKDLQNLQVNLLTSEKCQPLVTLYTIHEEEICSFKSVGTGPCREDGGDPLVSDGEIVGTFSFLDSDECDDGTPGIYSNVFINRDFIESIINE